MRKFVPVFVSVGLVGVLLFPGIREARAQKQATVAELFRQLQSEETSNTAERQLEKLARHDPAARKYLASHLPALLRVDPMGTHAQYEKTLRLSSSWCDSVQLAGKLKIIEAAPALARWITVSTSPGLRNQPLTNNPAALALVEIGDPSVPLLKTLLGSNAKDERWNAAYALFEINSMSAKSTLREYAASGRDRELARFIADGVSQDTK